MTARGRSSKVLLALLMALALMGVACGDDTGGNTDAGGDTPAESEEAPEEEAAAATLDFNATEYAFSVDAESVPAGMTTVNLINVGEEPHMLDLVHLTDDAPALEKLIKMPERKLGQYFQGQPIHIKTIKPGKELSKEVDLQPGRWAYVCFYAEKGEPPHAFQGMVGEMTVQ